MQGELDQLLATGVELHRQGHVQQAALLYQTILGVDARHADALHLLGLIAHQARDYEQACELIGRALAVNAQAPQYHFNRGVSLQALRRHADAADAYRRAAALRPDYKEAYENLGVALQDLNELPAAADAYGRALAIDADSAIANQNLGTLLGNLGRTEQARLHFAKVLERHPLYGEAHMKRAWTLLLDGELAEGWQEYEWRQHSETFLASNPVRIVPFPKWDGSPLAGKTLLINAEQGIGDEIMFASCYPDAVAAAQHCVIECDPRLASLLGRSFPQATIIAGDRSSQFRWSDAQPAIDYRVPAGSLPRFFRTKLTDFPAPASAYLQPSPELRAKWRATFAALAKPLTIGISWRGGRDARSSAARTIALAEWRSVLAFPDANFVSLQYGEHAEELAALEREHALKVLTPEGVDPLTDVDEFVALIAALDLVISIDNSTVFMAGAVGTPVWVLLPASGEWRWLKQRSTTPWYASATLFRQSEPNLAAWRTVLDTVARELSLRQFARGAEPPAARVESRAARAAPPPGAPRRAGTAVLLNDTSQWYHHGCSCTSLAIHAELRSQWRTIDSIPIHKTAQLAHLPAAVEAFDDAATFARFADGHADILATLAAADVVYVNAEGSLHGAGSHALGLLYLMHVATTRLGRAVHVINHSCYPDDTATPSDNPLFALYKKVYERLAFVAVRESVSARLVAQMGIRATPSFDCLPLFVARYFRPPVERRRKSVVIAGSVHWGGANVLPGLVEYIERMHAAGFEPRVLTGANAYLAADDAAFVAALRGACLGSFELVTATCELEWLQTIADAALLVSGRFHHTIAAAFVGTPFLVMESNTPKIAGLMEMLRSSAFVAAAQPALADVLLDRSRQLIESAGCAAVSREVRDQLLELARQNFRARAT